MEGLLEKATSIIR